MQLDGYGSDGRLEADLQRLALPHVLAFAAPLPSEALRQRLPEATQKLLWALATRLRSGHFPDLSWLVLNERSWGPVPEGRVVRGEHGDDVGAELFSVGWFGEAHRLLLRADGSLWLADRKSWQLEPHVAFESLDEALFAIVQREAIAMDSSRYEGALKALIAERASAEQENGWSALHEDIVEQLEDEEDDDGA